MQRLNVTNYELAYEMVATKACPVEISNHLFIEDKKLPKYLVGSLAMNFETFYHEDCPEFIEEDYQLSPQFLKIVQRFPQGNPQKVQLTTSTHYQIQSVPVFIQMEDVLSALENPDKYADFWREYKKIQNLQAIFLEEVDNLPIYKCKKLKLNGTFGKRKLLSGKHVENVKKVQEKLFLSRELYAFAFYSYAGMVEFKAEFGVHTYEAFQEAYGQYIYSFCLKKNGKTLPLVWPDYLYHKPDHHLEFGIPLHTTEKRYANFLDWQAGEVLTLEILAEGFEDVIFETELKPFPKSAPRLSKQQYNIGEKVILNINAGIMEELLQEKSEFTIKNPKGEMISGYDLPLKFEGAACIFQEGTFDKLGYYQMKIKSEKYGEMLFLFRTKELEEKA